MFQNITKKEYQILIEKDLALINKYLPESFDRDHINLVLCNSIDVRYPQVAQGLEDAAKEWSNTQQKFYSQERHNEMVMDAFKHGAQWQSLQSTTVQEVDEELSEALNRIAQLTHDLDHWKAICQMKSIALTALKKYRNAVPVQSDKGEQWVSVVKELVRLKRLKDSFNDPAFSIPTVKMEQDYESGKEAAWEKAFDLVDSLPSPPKQ